MGHKDLRLGQIVYILVFCNIPFSWPLPLDRFQFICLLRDSENNVLFWNTNMAIHIFSPHPLPEIVLAADKTTEKHSVMTLATRALVTLAVFWGWDFNPIPKNALKMSILGIFSAQLSYFHSGNVLLIGNFVLSFYFFFSKS